MSASPWATRPRLNPIARPRLDNARPGLAMVLAGAALAAVLAGCGVRGSLENPASSTEANQTASADSGQGKKEDAAPKPHRDFILDGLLR